MWLRDSVVREKRPYIRAAVTSDQAEYDRQLEHDAAEPQQRL